MARPRLPYCLLSLLTLFVSSVSGKDSYAWHAATVRGDEQAVLVLCPGMNQDGAFFLEESPWMDFARAHRLGVIALAFRSDPLDMYNEKRKGYYWPEQGSGQALLDAVGQTYGSDLPILVYGFSGGAQFASRFVEWAPQEVRAWAAYSAQFWDSPRRSAVNPPGIVACGELDGSRWFASYAHFYQGRALGKPWAWVSLPETGHVRHGAFEAFVRDFFSAAAGGDRSAIPAAYADIGTGERVPVLADSLQPELLAVLPARSLFPQWRGIHAP